MQVEDETARKIKKLGIDKKRKNNKTFTKRSD